MCDPEYSSASQTKRHHLNNSACFVHGCICGNEGTRVSQHMVWMRTMAAIFNWLCLFWAPIYLGFLSTFFSCWTVNLTEEMETEEPWHTRRCPENSLISSVSSCPRDVIWEKGVTHQQIPAWLYYSTAHVCIHLYCTLTLDQKDITNWICSNFIYDGGRRQLSFFVSQTSFL